MTRLASSRHRVIWLIWAWMSAPSQIRPISAPMPCGPVEERDLGVGLVLVGTTALL